MMAKGWVSFAPLLEVLRLWSVCSWSLLDIPSSEVVCYWAVFSSDPPSVKVKLRHAERGTLLQWVCFVIAASD